MVVVLDQTTFTWHLSSNYHDGHWVSGLEELRQIAEVRKDSGMLLHRASKGHYKHTEKQTPSPILVRLVKASQKGWILFAVSLVRNYLKYKTKNRIVTSSTTQVKAVMLFFLPYSDLLISTRDWFRTLCRYQICRSLSPLYKRAKHLHLTFMHSSLYFKSSRDYLQSLIQMSGKWLFYYII